MAAETSPRPIPEPQALAWIAQVLRALEYLHARNIIHCDVKPINVKICPDPDSPTGDQVYLVDFGLAKAYDPLLSTTAGARGITPGHAPPEQYGMGRTDARTNLYSVGATVYALLTGANAQPMPSTSSPARPTCFRCAGSTRPSRPQASGGSRHSLESRVVWLDHHAG